MARCTRTRRPRASPTRPATTTRPRTSRCEPHSTPPACDALRQSGSPSQSVPHLCPLQRTREYPCARLPCMHAPVVRNHVPHAHGRASIPVCACKRGHTSVHCFTPCVVCVAVVGGCSRQVTPAALMVPFRCVLAVVQNLVRKRRVSVHFALCSCPSMDVYLTTCAPLCLHALESPAAVRRSSVYCSHALVRPTTTCLTHPHCQRPLPQLRYPGCQPQCLPSTRSYQIYHDGRWLPRKGQSASCTTAGAPADAMPAGSMPYAHPSP